MRTAFSLSIHLTPKTRQRLNRAARRTGISRDALVEFAVKDLLEELGHDGPGIDDRRRTSLQASLGDNSALRADGQDAQPR